MSTDAHPSPPTTTTIPSNPDIPTPSSAAAPPNPPSKPSPSVLQRLRLAIYRALFRLATSTDRTLVRLSKLLSSPSSTDALLCTLSYTLTLVSALLSRALTARLSSLATDLATKADSVLLPGETLVATVPASRSTQWIAQTATTSQALATVIADFRVFVRLWGLAGLYAWARATYKAPLPRDSGAADRALRGLTWAQIGSCVAFQVLENGAYLASKGALTSAAWAGETGKARETRWWVWSSRFWALHVGLDLVRLAVLWRCCQPRTASGDGEKEEKLERERERRAKWVWWRDVVSNLAYAPMTLHWSVEEGFLSEAGVGLLGAVAGGAMLADAWRGTA